MKKITKEELAKRIFEECIKDGEPVSMEDALEMAEYEIASSEISSYTVSEEPGKKRKSNKKIDEQKAEIIKILHKALIENGFQADITNIDKTIDFDDYTVNLVKHRKK